MNHIELSQIVLKRVIDLGVCILLAFTMNPYINLRQLTKIVEVIYSFTVLVNFIKQNEFWLRKD